MPTIKAKVIRLNDVTREIFAPMITEPLLPTANYLLVSEEGFLIFEEKPFEDEPFSIRIPQFAMLSYYDLEFESE